MTTFFPALTTLSTILAFFCLSTNVGAQCAHPDFSALESFYEATNGSDWTDNSGWLSDCAPCDWAGVGCDAENRVVSIILRNNGLTGVLPAEIADLDRLELLSLWSNQIGGTLPAGLFSIPTLKEINLTRNRLTGTIPATLGSQPNLEYLRMGENQLTGTVPSGIASLTQIRLIMLEENNLTGVLPEGLGDLPNLNTIGFTNNDLEGCFPMDLAALCGQSRIMFGGNEKMAWKGDFFQLCGSSLDESQVGAPCDDGNPDTSGDVITQNCGCRGGVTSGAGSGLVGLGGFSERDALTYGDSQPLTGFGSTAPPALQNTTPEVFDVAVFPNPVVGNELTVRLPHNAGSSTLRLLSITGRELLRQVSSQTSTLVRLPELKAGLYLVEVTNGDSRSVERIMVQ